MFRVDRLLPLIFMPCVKAAAGSSNPVFPSFPHLIYSYYLMLSFHYQMQKKTTAISAIHTLTHSKAIAPRRSHLSF